MVEQQKIWMASTGENRSTHLYLEPSMANRHGLIAGATGTGKTITLKVMAESLSKLGVPVFLADVKGDLAGMCLPGEDNAGMQKRITKFGMEEIWNYQEFPTCFWDVFGEKGHPVRTTMTEMGPMLLARILGLTEVQEGVLHIIFKVADAQGLPILDMKDLRAMIQYVSDNRADYTVRYGMVSPQSLGAIQRALLELEDQGGDLFFGEPALDIHDWMRVDENGQGYINVLHSEKLIQSPDLYAAFLLWMLSELFEQLPEEGDMEKPKMVFFFDEAHLLFEGAPKELIQKIVQVVKLIRSKGVGVYFISQSPSDIPDEVLAQLGNRIQHALRAYTPAEQKAVQVAARTFRANPAFDTANVISDLGIGEALVSFLDEEGRPGIVERAFILPPQSLMGAIEDAVRAEVMAESRMKIKYDEPYDRESAYEKLVQKIDGDDAGEVKAPDEEMPQDQTLASAQASQETAKERLDYEDKLTSMEEAELARQRQQLELEKKMLEQEARHQKEMAQLQEKMAKEAEKKALAEQKKKEKEEERRKQRMEKTIDRGISTAFSTITREASKSIVRGLFGSLKK